MWWVWVCALSEYVLAPGGVGRQSGWDQEYTRAHAVCEFVFLTVFQTDCVCFCVYVVCVCVFDCVSD